VNPQEKIKALKKRVRELERDLRTSEERKNGLVKTINEQTIELLDRQGKNTALKARVTEFEAKELVVK
jgi:predicted RNase H-like nuclease (RuvC/YqgF family)